MQHASLRQPRGHGLVSRKQAMREYTTHKTRFEHLKGSRFLLCAGSKRDL